MRPRFLAPLLFSLALVFAFPAPGAAWSRGGPVLDAIDIQRAHRELYALRDAAPPAALRLESREEVVWSGAQGHVGVVVTTRRVLGVTRAHGWREYRLRSEDGQAFVQLGGRVALVVTARRALWLDGPSGALHVQRLGSGERIVTSGARDDVAVVVTNRRGLGFSEGRKYSIGAPIGAQERFYGLRVLGSAGTIETSRRFLVFSAGSWVDRRRALR